MRTYKPRKGLPKLPPLHKLVRNRVMAEALGVAKSTILAHLRSVGLRGQREVSLWLLTDMKLGTGKAARLLGCSRCTVLRQIAADEIVAERAPDGYRRISLDEILRRRAEIKAATRRARTRARRRRR